MSNSARSDLEAARPLFAALAVSMLGNGLLGTIVGIRAELERFPTTITGLVMSSYYIGFLVGCGMAPRLLRQRGHVRVFLVLSLLSAAFAIAYPINTTPATWAVFRFVTGAATAGIYVVCESWLAGAGHPRTRGRLLAVYLLVVNAGYGLGQLLLGIGSPQGFMLFGVAAGLIALAALPLIAVKTEGLPKTNLARLRISELIKAAPLGVATSFVTGIGVGGILGFGAVYGTGVGMSVQRVGLLLGAAMAGGIVLQWPIGALSDRINRRHVTIGATLLAGAFAIAASYVEPLFLG